MDMGQLSFAYLFSLCLFAMAQPDRMLLKNLSKDGRILDIILLKCLFAVAMAWVAWVVHAHIYVYIPNLRRLRREMAARLDKDEIKEEQSMLPGGDIRQKGNQWLRKAWQASEVARVPREAEFRKIIKCLVHQYSLCISILKQEFAPSVFLALLFI